MNPRLTCIVHACRGLGAVSHPRARYVFGIVFVKNCKIRRALLDCRATLAFGAMIGGNKCAKVVVQHLLCVCVAFLLNLIVPTH